MTERDNLDMLAAEFVLGTLPLEQRHQVQARRGREPELEALIQRWEERLATMADGIDPVPPSAELYGKILSAIEQESGPDAGQGTVVALQRQVNRWRWSTALASAAAMVLVAVMTFQPDSEPAPASFVAVFQQNDQQPAFLLTVNLDQRLLNIRPVTAKAQPDKSYQLWIKSDELGPKPRSVGVLGDQFQLDRAALRQYDPALLRGATFGISVEPPGGSPTGQPTGPAIHGYLYPADAPANGESL